jgi:hypothetical protein
MCRMFHDLPLSYHNHDGGQGPIKPRPVTTWPLYP